MELSTKDFHVLDALDSYEITTQRQLSERAGISLGHVNYVLKVLLKKGLIKIDDFYQSTNKKNYVLNLAIVDFAEYARHETCSRSMLLQMFHNVVDATKAMIPKGFK